MSSQPFYLAGVMGWPVAHSRSPLIHNYWLQKYGLTGAYVQLPVVPGTLGTAIAGLKALGFKGCNLTIPHKVDAMAFMDEVDPIAQRMGAMNTIVVQADGSLKGFNNDGYGYIQSLLDTQPDWRADAGPVTALADEFGDEFGEVVKALPWADRHAALEGIALLVNTTSQGMHGNPALDLDLSVLPTTALVSDVIYVPLETPLLQAAKSRGNPTVDGLGMLLNQARPAFEAWFGVLPEITPELRRMVEATL